MKQIIVLFSHKLEITLDFHRDFSVLVLHYICLGSKYGQQPKIWEFNFVLQGSSSLA